MGPDRSADVGGRQLVRHGTASARRHRGLYARRVEAQEAAHPLRHAFPSVLQRGRPARPAALLRLLAQGHRQRRDAGAAGEARDPHRARRIPFPPRERMAARAHAVDQTAPRFLQAGRRRGQGHCRHAGEGEAGERRRRGPIPPAAPPMPAMPRPRPPRCRQRRAGISLVTPPLEQDTEITGPLVAQLWVSSTTEDMDLLLTLRNIDPDGKDVLEIGQQGQPVPVAKGWLRVSHRELDPDLSLPYRPYHKHLRRLWLKPNEIVAGAGGDLADVDGVQEGPSHPARHPAARRHRQRALYALPCRLQCRGQHASIPAATRNRTCCCRSFRRSSPPRACPGQASARLNPSWPGLRASASRQSILFDRSVSRWMPGSRFASPGHARALEDRRAAVTPP